ncbi:hypothetical protein [Oricola sp.]|nr:hypothetical protein [Oricola sp.]MCI5073502.1 hypothetical protein [Oricola sp.]
MRLTMKLTLAGLIRALRTRAAIAAEDGVEAARQAPPKPDEEDRDERRP